MRKGGAKWKRECAQREQQVNQKKKIATWTHMTTLAYSLLATAIGYSLCQKHQINPPSTKIIYAVEFQSLSS